MSAIKQRPLMFFFLNQEEYQEGNVSKGYIRVVDQNTSQLITKIEVSRTRETFSFLKKFLTNIKKEISRPVESSQCFSIMWNDKVARTCLDSNIDLMNRLAEDVQLRLGLRSLSERLLAIK